MTQAQSIAAGSGYLVIGRLIIEAANPKATEAVINRNRVFTSGPKKEW